MSNERTYNNVKWVEQTEASAKVLTSKRPVLVIGTEEIRKGMDDSVLQQVEAVASAPGIEKVVLGPDFHLGYGCPVGCVFSSSTHVYPCAVGPDIACSMGFISFDIDAEEIASKEVRRKLINAIGQRVPVGTGTKQAPKGRRIPKELLWTIACTGAHNPQILEQLGINPSWADSLEDRSRGGGIENLDRRLGEIKTAWGSDKLYSKLAQVGSLGGGNHFLECDVIKTNPLRRFHAQSLGLKDGSVGVMTHCGSRGFGFNMTSDRKIGQFEKLKTFFQTWGIVPPGNDYHMVYAPVGTPEADQYLMDMALGANFAIVNHLLLLTYVNEAFKEVLGNQIDGKFLYHIAHNIIREEIDPDTNRKTYVHRKGATRSMPGDHFSLKGTKYEGIGHPILLPGNCEVGSAIMVGDSGAKNTLYSVNHGAGRQMGRKEACRKLVQTDIDKRLSDLDILYNTRQYPLDEAGPAYKDFDEVLKSVGKAGLAVEVARLHPKFVFKDNDSSPEGSA